MLENKYEDIIKAQKGDKEIITSLVNNNMGLVYSITKRFQGRGFEMEDLNQIGTLGLIKAITLLIVERDGIPLSNFICLSSHSKCFCINK